MSPSNKENPSVQIQKNENPVTIKTKEELSACLKDIKAGMMIWENESIWNDPELVKLRQKVYEWEKKIYSESNGTLHHRKFLRNYLIQLESGFEEGNRSKTGAKWMMQITGSVPEDIKKRPYLYKDQIRKIGYVPEVYSAVPKNIKNTLEEIVNKPKVAVDISPVAKYLASPEGKKLLMSNGYVNAYFGSIHLWILHESVNKESIPDELRYYANLKEKINYKKINILIRDKLLSIEPNPAKIVKIPEITEQTYTIFLKTLWENPELVRSIFAARRYNGSDKIKWYTWYGNGMREKDVYFIAIGYATTMAMLTDDHYRSAYCKADKKAW